MADRYDRLSALISRFDLRVLRVPLGEGNMVVFGESETGQPGRVEIRTRGGVPTAGPNETSVAACTIDWGGPANPLMAALPATVSIPIRDAETRALLDLFLAEAGGRRCGSDKVLERLAEVLVIRLMRQQIEQGAAEPGVLAGLADPRLSRAISALHEDPGKPWSNGDLAAIAGMSLSRFADAFRAVVGEAPQSYLRRWRMTLARQDMDRGARVQAVARRYGYASSEALSRAFHRQFGVNPTELRRTG
ncbi:MAG: cupin [Rhodospirillaceae bacterium]|nr:cupin [Magnetovibrio sp.]MAY67761.1 cupin [Rhodospirillaceae bacterium]